MTDPYAPPEWYDPKTVIQRLRGVYTMPVNDGMGLLDGKDTFTREYPGRPAIQVAAAQMIQDFESGHMMDRRKVELMIESLKKPADPLGIGVVAIVPIHREAIARLRELIS